MGEWQPIETAPKGKDVLLFFPKVEGRNYLREWIRVGFKDDCIRKPTHWMPLPEPPQ